MTGFQAKKTAGKIFAAFTAALLLCCTAVYRYIGGQTRTAEKFFSAAASGNYKNYSGAVQEGYTFNLSEKNFKEECRAYFAGLPEFSEMGETDIISSKIKIKSRTPEDGIKKWRLIMDVDFFSSGNSVSYDGLTVYMEYSRGKWRIWDIE